MLTRERLGYAPGMMDIVYLWQDIEALDAAMQSPDASSRDLLPQATAVEAEARRIGVPDLITKGLLQRSKILLADGQYADAIEALTAAEQVLGELRQDDLKVAILGGLAEAHARLGRWETVAKVCEQGIRLVEIYRREVSGQYLQSAYLRSRIHLYAHGVRAAFEEGQYETMLRWAELSKCRSVLRTGRRSASPSDEENRTRERFLAVSQEIEEARLAGDTGNADALETLCMQRRTLWDLLLIQRSEGDGEADVPEFRLSDLQSLLAADEAVLYYYWVDPQTLLIVAIARDDLRVELQSAAEHREPLRQFSAGILEDLVPGKPGGVGYIDEGNRFADLLLPRGIVDFLDANGRQRRRLLISPHRELHAFPFHALPWDAGHRHLIQRFAVAYVPNLTCLLASYPASPRRRLLALGICDYNLPGETLPPLEDAVAEAAEVARLYEERGHEAIVWPGRQANESSLRQLVEDGRLESFTTLHIATHGRNVDSDTPMESCLYLYDSLLEGLEIADWRLDAELVVLSACCSGQRAIKGRGLDELPGDDLFGLQAAFFAAGAKWVLGSLWPVHSQTARQIMTRFQEFLLTGQAPDIALQSAVREYLKTAGLRMRKSLYWAPFFLSTVGRPAAGRSQEEPCPRSTWSSS